MNPFKNVKAINNEHVKSDLLVDNSSENFLG